MAEADLTLAEFLRQPETDPPSEYIDGGVVQKPPLQGPDRWLRADLAALLYGWARASRSGAVASEIRCAIGGDVYVVDVAYFGPGCQPAAAALLGPPDFAIEVCPREIDPSWVGTRLAYFVAHGVRLAWLVDPLDETVTVYRPEVEPLVVPSGGMLEGGDVLPSFYLHVDDLYAVLGEDDELS